MVLIPASISQYPTFSTLILYTHSSSKEHIVTLRVTKGKTHPFAMFEILLSIAVVLLVSSQHIVTCDGFTPQRGFKHIPGSGIQVHRKEYSQCTTVLNVSFGLNDFDFHDTSEYEQMIVKARECAFSDDDTASSSEEAQHYLFDIFHMENSCVSGTVNGEYCDTKINDVAEIVARLRQKIRSSSVVISQQPIAATTNAGGVLQNESQMLLAKTSVVTPRSTGNTVDGSSMMDFILPNILVVLFFGAFLSLLVNSWHPTTAEITAFENHEWSWVTQDGYHNSLISHYVRNGGL